MVDAYDQKGIWSELTVFSIKQLFTKDPIKNMLWLVKEIAQHKQA